LNLRLKGKVAIVTGGATGIGEHIVRAYVREGAATVLIDPKEAEGRALVSELSTAGRCQYFCGDISRESDCAAVVKEAERLFGPVTILANNAAKFVFRSYEATVEEWEASLKVNVIGASLATRYAVESMKRAGGGAIVNLGSISSFIAQPATMTYNATKAALVEMTRCLALDLAPFHIRVNCVCPGYTVTPALKAYIEQCGGKLEDAEKQLSQQTILKRLGRPEEIAHCVVFLSSDEASYVTGSALMADGGLTAL
jgi:dihydroanticapsin dehydrogenase